MDQKQPVRRSGSPGRRRTQAARYCNQVHSRRTNHRSWGRGRCPTRAMSMDPFAPSLSLASAYWPTLAKPGDGRSDQNKYRKKAVGCTNRQWSNTGAQLASGKRSRAYERVRIVGIFSKKPALSVSVCDMCGKTDAQGCGSKSRHVERIAPDSPNWLPAGFRAQAQGHYTWLCVRCNSHPSGCWPRDSSADVMMIAHLATAHHTGPYGHLGSSLPHTDMLPLIAE